ncbi:hypothetical protein [Streptomyces sp. AC495_CC817]|uniref:hypothetical protein n=1 Tax=Streptomyces sp. AC495_CC817 TaxID=2823900 RepID=UPI001C263359|nr:hypothetical protein [Streptomyces sp. AC495_CC817]
MSRATAPRRGLSIVAGGALVAVFLAWLVIRNQEAVSAALGMHTLLGGIVHGLAITVLFGGVALIAWGTLGGRDETVDPVLPPRE